MFCGNCGASDQSGKFCSKCGFQNIDNPASRSESGNSKINSQDSREKSNENGYSITGLVIGLISYFLFGLSFIQFFLVLPAIIFSHVGYSRLQSKNSGSKGLAIAPLVVSYFSLAFFILGFIDANR